ncbi:ZIP family metal transporter [Actinoplanes subtropicus]|uniref:ZIP family metal transporter n=1 Tax=Actinoplanes subtropicus TaxID=543632 RepID=UPI0004C321C6|nr:ZIP family metal transporter [Actinoplanes subtropicus]
MSATKIALLGAIAGFTIFLGLPIGRLRNPAPRLRAMLNATAVGILVFLLWDVLAHAWEPIDGALGEHHYGSAVGNGVVLATGLGAGLLGLVYFDRWVARRGGAARPVAVPAPEPVAVPAGGGDRAAAQVTLAPQATGWRSPAGQLALMIATGIGLHNFAEGLAIGNSAASGEIALAVLLIVGFGLHNATEGFGIVAPLAAAGDRPSWGYLTTLGLIGGGPTFLGTLVGQRFTNETVSIAFLALAAGSILYVVIELLAVGRKMGVKEITTWGLLLGLLAGFLTDAIVTAGGA